MTDADFLRWIAGRFVNVIGESENVDFVIKLRNMADELEARGIDDLSAVTHVRWIDD